MKRYATPVHREVAQVAYLCKLRVIFNEIYLKCVLYLFYRCI